MISPLESVARALFGHYYKPEAWGKVRPSVRADFLEQASKAMVAARVPSKEMVDRGDMIIIESVGMSTDIYQAMIDEMLK